MGATCSIIGGENRCIRVLVAKLEGKRPLRRPRCGWEYDIKMYLQEVGWGNELD
jgi:hypothetical protein